ncbi:MAG: signal peptidase II [Desulfovibrio sp.]|jgi:signal peptidase II|nr:signal peptidase II [Desulfovibrio sp.]
MRYCIIISLTALLATLDQASKWLLDKHLAANEIVRLTSFFNLVNVRNYGAAFGLLNDPSNTWNFLLFFVSTTLALIVVVYLAKQAAAKDRLLFCSLGGLSGGALGNFIDRLRNRSVTDFLDFHIADYHWPAFNVADICICTGAFAIALLMLRPSRAETANRL